MKRVTLKWASGAVRVNEVEDSEEFLYTFFGDHIPDDVTVTVETMDAAEVSNEEDETPSEDTPPADSTTTDDNPPAVTSE